MLFQLHAIPPGCASVVRHAWSYQRSAPFAGRLDEPAFRPPVDGCPGIVMQRGFEPSLTFGPGDPLPRVFVYGQTLAPRTFAVPPAMDLVGFNLRPDALYALFGLEAHAWTDECLDLLEWDGRHRSALWRALEAPSAEAAITALGTWIQGLTEQGQTGLDAPSAEALDLITRSAGQESLRQLHRHVGVSERSLERRFKTSIGLGPKRYARICRFKAALRDLQQGRFTQLTTLAYSHGYTDQSHFIREFRQFTGLTPGQYPSAMADMHQRLSRMA